MSAARRPKRKAAVAALDAIAVQMKEQDDEDDEPIAEEEDLWEPVLFCSDIALPKELVLRILEFLPKKELVHRASLVSSAWCKATKHPLLWPALEADIWKKYPGDLPSKMAFSSMRQFHLFLGRPQFARLKTLVPPDIYRTLHRNVFDRIAEVNPFLEDLDLSGRSSIRQFLLVPFPEELPRLPALFQNLKKLRLCMRHVEQQHLVEFARLMGERLVELSVFTFALGKSFSDETFEAIAQNCPNLETFEYEFGGGLSSADGRLTKRGPIAVIKGCPKLKIFRVTVPFDVCPHVNRFVEENGYSSRLSLVLWYPKDDDLFNDSDSDSDLE